MTRGCLLLLAAGLACGRREEPQAEHPPPGEIWLTNAQLESQGIRVEPAVVRDVEARLDAPARIAFDDLHVAHVYSPVSGRVTRIFAQPGQRVRKGDALARIESPDAGSAASDLRKAAADAAVAERELSRVRELVEAGAGARRDLDQAQNAADRARAELARARQRAHTFGTGGQAFVLRAPIAGEVIARNANPGVELQGQWSGTSPELFTVGSIDEVWALADIAEADLASVQIGAAAEVRTIAHPADAARGRVEWMSSALDPATRSARVRIPLANPAHALLPEMYAMASIAIPARRVLAVPRSAIVHAGDDRIVFVLTGDRENGQHRIQRRKITVDDTGAAELVAVGSGLSAGEVVVVQGAILLSGML